MAEHAHEDEGDRNAGEQRDVVVAGHGGQPEQYPDDRAHGDGGRALRHLQRGGGGGEVQRQRQQVGRGQVDVGREADRRERQEPPVGRRRLRVGLKSSDQTPGREQHQGQRDGLDHRVGHDEIVGQTGHGGRQQRIPRGPGGLSLAAHPGEVRGIGPAVRDAPAAEEIPRGRDLPDLVGVEVVEQRAVAELEREGQEEERDGGRSPHHGKAIRSSSASKRGCSRSRSNRGSTRRNAMRWVRSS